MDWKKLRNKLLFPPVWLMVLLTLISAAALVNHTSLETPDSFRNNAAYIQNWLQVLKDDKRFIVSAAGKAEKAVNLILGAAG